MHDVVKRHTPFVHHHSVVVHQQPGRSVRQLGTDGIQRGLRHQFLDILLRRSLRAKAPGHAHFRLELVLLRWLPVRDHAVRHHGRLEIVRAHHRGRAAVEHRTPLQGERKPILFFIIFFLRTNINYDITCSLIGARNTNSFRETRNI